MSAAAIVVLLIFAPGGKWLDGVVNLNTATAEELQLLPGVGPAKVRNIVAYRRKHPFKTADELVRIKGIGRKMVRRLRAHLAVTGPTTARPAPPPPPLPPPPPKPTAVLLARRPHPPVAALRKAAAPPPARFRAARGNHCEPRS